MTKIKPIGERLLIKQIKSEERTKAGIYLPESAKEERKEAEIIEIGSKVDEKLGLKNGDKIIYGGYSSDEIEINKEKFLIIELKDVLARVEE